MKLLVVAQRVDSRDPILGFFHAWLAAFAERCETVLAVGQAVGAHDLPANVSVRSLGKERGWGRFTQVIRYWRLLRKLRGEYDAVFVHMSPVWVVLGFPLLFLLRKPVYLWYEVRRGGRVLRWAVRCARCVFSATPYGLPFRSPKNLVVGHGIDVDRFRPGGDRDPRLLCAVGRITRIKNLEQCLRALADLPPSYRLFLAGGTVTRDDERYREELQAFLRKRRLEERVVMRWIAPEELPAVLRQCSLFLHGGGGGLDKALLEAMACACPVVSSSAAAQELLPASCRATTETFSARAAALLSLPDADREELGRRLRGIVVSSHGLPSLADRLVAEMEKAS
ncbi:MAG: glycosyltransferase family 4 protein [Candidatus Peribacteraceae bacterium]|nr:glycosyltransferase family 4 protein [Candidatus Peribacteraceae bacterium]